MKVGERKSSEHLYRAEYLKAWRVLEERPDWLIYKPVKTIRVMWDGIISSYKYTNSDYLSILDGWLSNKNLPRWMKKFAEQLLAHNNNAESPFAGSTRHSGWIESLVQSTPSRTTPTVRNSLIVKVKSFERLGLLSLLTKW